MANKHIYISPQAKGLKFRITVGDKDVTVKFMNGQFSTDDDDLAKAIDKALTTTQIRRFARKVDRAAAEELALKHAEQTARTGAHKGGVSADAIKHAMDKELQERDLRLQNEGGDRLIDQFDEEENLVLTQEGVTQPSTGLANDDKGGDPTSDLPVGKQAKDAEPEANEPALATEEVPAAKPLKFGS